MNRHFSAIVAGYNRVWHQLYYDVLDSTPDYDISLTSIEPMAFYSAAHLLTPLNNLLLQDIEKTCDAYDIHRAIFIDIDDTEGRHILLDHGYTKIVEESEKWYIRSIDNDIYQMNVAQNISIEAFTLNNDEKRSIFLQIDALTNHLSSALIAQMESLMLMRSSYPATFFLAYKDGVPCGCAMLHHYDNIVFFSEGGTLPEYRHCGIHTLLTIKRLQYAQELNADNAIMVCSLGSYSNNTAEKLGFALVGQREFYVLRNTNQL